VWRALINALAIVVAAYVVNQIQPDAIQWGKVDYGMGEMGRYLSLILMLQHLPLAAAPPPALPLLAWAACQIYLAGRGRGVQREAVDPPSSKAQA